MVTQQESIGKSSAISGNSAGSKSNTQKDKKNKKNTGNVTTKVTTYKTTGTLITLTAGQDNPVNELTSDLIGGTITITNPHTLVESDLYTTAFGYTLPTTYSSTILNVKNSKEFEVLEPYKITDKNNKTFPVSLKSGNTTITYDTYKTFTEDRVYQRSYANITVGNLRTFSGDVYKAKIYTRDSGTSTDYEQVYENYVIPENELVDESSITGYDNIGFFHTESIIDNNWISSSTAGDTGQFVTLTNEKLIDSVSISGSVSGINDKIVFRTKEANTLQKGVDYVVRFNTYYYKSLSERRTSNNKIENKNYASLKVYLSGSAITGANGEDDFFVGEVDVTDSMGTEGEVLGVVGQFRTAGTGTTKTWLKFELNSGEFHIQDVSIEPFSETNFNPNFFKALVPMPKPVKRGDSYDFLVEFYDCNNNISTTTAEVKGVTFQGPRQVVADGLDGVFEGAMVLGESVEMYGSNPAYIRSVGYNGFDKTKAGTGERNGGFLIWSGSIGNGATLNRLTSSEAYEGVGIEILDASGSNTYNHSFLQFASNYKNTGNSRFRIQTKEFLLGLSGSGQAGDTYISGSAGNLEISSSNFLLARDGSVTMQGSITATAGGQIGGFTITDKAISTTDFFLSGSSYSGTGFDKTNLVLSSSGFQINSTGQVSASEGIIGGFELGSTVISSSNSNLVLSSSGQITGSNVKFDGGVIGGFELGSTVISSSNSKLVLSSSGQITGSDVLFEGGEIGGWTLSSTTLANGTDIVLDSSNKRISINDSTFGGPGVQLEHDTGTGKFYAGDGSNKFIQFDGINVEIESEKFELDANNLEISSTQASMSLGEGKIKLKGGSTSFMTIGTGGNAISASVDASDKFISIGKSDFSEFDQSTKGFIVGDNGGVFRFEVTLDAQNYMSFDGTPGATTPLDIKTKKFLLDTDNLDIDSDNKKITITDAQGTPRERVRIGKVDAGADNYGLKIFDGTGAAADGTILAEFSNDQNVIAGWNISTSTISSNNLILNSAGQISSQGYASNTQGFFLGAVEMADGSVGSFLEVDEARIRGTLKTTVFEKESVNAVGGQLHVANATTITGSVTMSADDTTMQVANASGFEAGEIILLKKFNSTGFTTEYMKIHSVSLEEVSDTNFSGSFVVTRSLGTSPTGGTDSGSIGGTGASAQEYTPGQVVVSTGKVGTGYIRLNANPNDLTTPYMDIVERTGTGVYDIDLKARLGDLSGIVDTINGQTVSGFGLYTDNAFLKGGIVANYGSIGGLNMSSTDLWAGNSSLGAGGTVMVIGDITSSPKIALGGTADSMDLNTGDGIFMSSSGEFRVGDIDGDRLIFESGNFAITSSNFGLDAGTLHISSSNNGAIALGTGGPGSQAPTQLDDNGILLSGSGQFNLQSGPSDYIRNGTSGFDIKAGTFGLDATTIIVSSSLNNGTIALGTAAGGMGLSSGNDGVYMDGGGNFRVGGASDNFLKFTGGTLSIDIDDIDITSSAFDLVTSTIHISSSGGGTIAMGSTIPKGGDFTDTGIMLSGSGYFNLQASPTNYIRNNASGFDIKSDTFTLDATTLTIDSSGDGGAGSITVGSNVTLNGSSNSTISGFTLGSSQLYTNAKSTLASSEAGVYIGTDGIALGPSSPFKVTSAGTLTATGATISGNLTATTLTATSAGSIGGWTIGGTTLTGGNVTLNSAGIIEAGSLTGISDTTNTGFYVDNNGQLLVRQSATDFMKFSGGNLDLNATQLKVYATSSNAGIIMDSTTPIVMVTGSRGSVTGNSVKLLGDEGVLEVSQSGQGVFDTGRTRTFVTSTTVEFDPIKPLSFGGVDKPDVITTTTDTQAAPRMDNLDIDGTIDTTRLNTDRIRINGGATDRTDIYFQNTSPQFGVLENAATNPIPHFLFIDENDTSFADVSSGCSGNQHPSFVFHKTISGSHATDQIPVGYRSGSSGALPESGSSIFTISTTMTAQNTGDIADAQFNLLALDTNLSGIHSSHQNEYTFLQARHSGSIRAQLQHDGDFVSKGNITAFGTTFLQVSDQRLKKDVHTISGSMNKILQLRPTEFTWIDNNKQDVGFIAQEVEKIIPEVIEISDGFINTGDDQQIKTISYPKLVPYLVDTIQQLTKRIEELEKKVK